MTGFSIAKLSIFNQKPDSQNCYTEKQLTSTQHDLHKPETERVLDSRLPKGPLAIATRNSVMQEVQLITPKINRTLGRRGAGAVTAC